MPAGFGLPGAIIICGSIAGSTTIRDRKWVGYNASKCAILQMTRSMACELGINGIRVNTLSAGQIQNGIVTSTMKGKGLADEWASRNTLGRLARLDEMRGVTVWLASDASSYCTGSEYVPASISSKSSLTHMILFQHRSQWWLQ